MILSRRLLHGSSKGSPLGTKANELWIAKFSSTPGEASSEKTATANENPSVNTDSNINPKSSLNGSEAQTPSVKAQSGTSGSENQMPSVKSSGTNLKALLEQKQVLLKQKDRMVADAKQEVLTCLAEVENLRGRTRRDAESIKKYAVESFAADLLDMADNLHRTAAIVPESFRKDVLANDTSSNGKLLTSMLEGVNMTEKQMLKIFGEFGVKKFDPIGDLYDSNHHLVIDEVDDSTKEPNTIVNVVKSGYFIREKVLRPAEVGIVKKKAAE